MAINRSNPTLTMRLLRILCLTACVSVASAQTKKIVDDNFSDNRNLWEINPIQIITNGEYIINSSPDGDESLLSRHIDRQKDYILAAEFSQLGGSNDCAFGLTWGDSDEDYNLFLISSSGEYVVYSGNPSDVKGWKKSNLLKAAQGQMHRLRVENIAGKMTFFINEAKVDERKSFPVFGNWLGVIVFDQGRISMDNFQFIQDQVIELPNENSSYEKEDLGTLINSDDDELGPIIASDGKTLYFARQNIAENTGGVDDDEDVWFSVNQHERWSFARNMGRPVNTPSSDNLVAVSADNNTLMFAKSNELFLKHRTENSWSESEKLKLSFQNQSEYFVASLTTDNKAVLFSAKLSANLFYDPKRNEGDLYVSVKDKSNNWAVPVNLGAKINTAGNETSPYLSADGKTLYFATDGRPGFGYQDIFYARRLDETWTNWSEPVNLGQGVNTPGFDAYYTVPASGDYAYYVSQGREEKADIYRIRLHEEVKPNPVTVLTGLVLNSKTKAPLSARIHFENLSSGIEVGEARSDPKTGAYRIVLPFGTTYGIRAALMGYYSVHENMELKLTGSKYTELRKDLFMTPLEVGETIKLNNVFFEAGLPVLKPESYPELNRLIEILKENPGIAIELAGHTDHKGDAATLLKLSEDRVKTVKSYLVTSGINESRIAGTGYGDTRPVAPSDTEENSQLNRRVEFKITKK
jgi:outer membrane protein OmpA-like peptidoglycan-associated protein